MSRPSVTYINQLAYADVPYPTTLNPGDVLREPYPSVARAGCGLCCVCMMVEFLTGERLSVEACITWRWRCRKALKHWSFGWRQEGAQ